MLLRLILFCVWERERERQTDRQSETDKERQRQTETDKERQTETEGGVVRV